MKAIAAILLSLVCQSAFAALVGVSDSAGTTSSASNTIAYTGTAIVAGDVEVLVTELTVGSAPTFTDPTTPGGAWTTCSSLTSPIADIRANGSDNLRCVVKIATSGDAGTPSYTTSANVSGYWKQQLWVFSGRVNSSINAAFPQNIATAAGAQGGFPYTYSLTGISSVPSGADILAVVAGALPSGMNSATSFGIAITGFTNPLVTDYYSYNYNGPLMALIDPNNGGGTIGPFSSTLSITGGSGSQIIPFGFVMAIPAGASASCTHPGLTSGGAISVPNGTSGSYRLKNGSFGTPDCSTVSYFQPTVGNFGSN